MRYCRFGREEHGGRCRPGGQNARSGRLHEDGGWYLQWGSFGTRWGVSVLGVRPCATEIVLDHPPELLHDFAGDVDLPVDEAKDLSLHRVELVDCRDFLVREVCEGGVLVAVVVDALRCYHERGEKEAVASEPAVANHLIQEAFLEEPSEVQRGKGGAGTVLGPVDDPGNELVERHDARGRGEDSKVVCDEPSTNLCSHLETVIWILGRCGDWLNLPTAKGLPLVGLGGPDVVGTIRGVDVRNIDAARHRVVGTREGRCAGVCRRLREWERTARAIYQAKRTRHRQRLDVWIRVRFVHALPDIGPLEQDSQTGILRRV